MSRNARALAIVATSLVGATSAFAQRAPEPDFRWMVGGYVAQYSLDDQLAAGQQTLRGVGVRVSTLRPDPDRGSRTSIFDRAQGSLFVAFTPRQGTPGMSTVHLGVQTDFSILRAPASDRFDPFFGLGLGLFSSVVDDQITRGKHVRRTDLALSPGVGLRIPFVRGVGARGDLRAPLVFGTNTTANLVAEAGLYFSF